MKKVFIIISYLLFVGQSFAGSHGGLKVSSVFVKNGMVIAQFNPTTSNSTSYAAVPYVYTESFPDYKNVLAILLQAKSQDLSVKIWQGSGGTPVNALLDNTYSGWASTISMIALE